MRGVTFSEFGNGQNVDMFVQAPDVLPRTPMIEAVETAKKIRQKYQQTYTSIFLRFPASRFLLRIF